MKKVSQFISDIEKVEVLSFVNSLKLDLEFKNEHINKVASKLNGTSYMFDITKTNLSNQLAKFQSSDNLTNITLPQIFLDLLKRISPTINISEDNVFLQILNQESGGSIHPHYDSSADGFITYKCNICLESDNYKLYVGDDFIEVSQGDLYCFEASLYKHWTEPFKNKRIILSYGFILPYSELGRTENDPRVRLSKRIEKYFQKS